MLVMSGSPVVGSSTEILLKAVAHSIVVGRGGEPTTVDFVRLGDLKFIPCQACGKAPTEGFCLYEDDLTGVYEQLATCDCLLLGSPVYFDSVSAQTKALVDRCNCFRPPDYDNIDPEHRFIRKLDRYIPGAMILVGGERGWFEGARRVVAGFFKWLDIGNDGCLYHRTRDFTRKGTAANDPEAMSQAADLGLHLAEKIKENQGR
ncbi:MAG: flavodoxin family protein [bacterium]